MTTTAQLLVDGYGRVQQSVHQVLDGLPDSALAVRLDPDANTIGWLVWHLSRVQDDHIADVAGTEQVWTARGWADRFGLPFDRGAIGYGQTSDEVGQVTGITCELLAGYYDDVHEATIGFVSGLRDADLDRVVDARWDPPVTLAVRLVSVISDDLQHAGQAAFARGVIERRG